MHPLSSNYLACKFSCKFNETLILGPNPKMDVLDK